jgi:hypothetical protein
MVSSRLFCLLAIAGAWVSGCGAKSGDTRGDASGPGANESADARAGALDATAAPSAADGGMGDAADAARDGAPADFTTWLRTKVPPSATIEGGPKVVHTVQSGDTFLSIATAYLDVTDVYYAKDLAALIAKQSPALVVGARIEIPRLITEPYKDPEHDRMRAPADRAIHAVFITGAYARILWPDTIEKLAARKQFNAIVLDAKDYEGPVTYPTKAKIAREIEADKEPFIPDMARAIRFAHARGIRVILRIPCFHDPLAAKKAKRISLQSLAGNPIDMGWLDPMNEEAQEYVMELVKEGIENGADEINLDYIRFPVVGPVKLMKLPPPRNGERTRAVRDIVRKVHALTAAADVPLSLDIFGVVATGERTDWEALGQDISVLGPECEALAPMVYPSHYGNSWRGMTEPGQHPEVIGIGTKMAVDLLPKGKKNAVIRSWLQAFTWKAPNYGPKYLFEEARQAEANKGVGWMMWSPSNDYSAAWNAWPPGPR